MSSTIDKVNQFLAKATDILDAKTKYDDAKAELEFAKDIRANVKNVAPGKSIIRANWMAANTNVLVAEKAFAKAEGDLKAVAKSTSIEEVCVFLSMVDEVVDAKTKYDDAKAELEFAKDVRANVNNVAPGSAIDKNDWMSANTNVLVAEKALAKAEANLKAVVAKVAQ